MFARLKAIYATLVAIYQYWPAVRDFVSAGAPVAGVYQLTADIDPQSHLPADVIPCPESTGLLCDGMITKVIDGDTLEVECRFTHRIRLLDCWCPETTLRMGTTPEEKQKGLDAKAFMQTCLLSMTNDHVRVFIPGHSGRLNEVSTLSRVLGRVWLIDPATKEPVGDTDLSGLMVRAGLATRTKPEEPA